MKCPFCGYTESKVIDTRPTDEGERIRRRRECLQCSKRFTSYEVVETTPVMVIKKDGSREAFSHDKLLRGERDRGGAAEPYGSRGAQCGHR